MCLGELCNTHNLNVEREEDCEEALNVSQWMIREYMGRVEKGTILASQHQTLKYIEGLRLHASILQKLGRIEEAEAWEKELNETEAIISTF